MGYKICSFDVGIRNLAYCVLEKQDDGTCKVLEWDIVDLLNTKEKKLTCCGLQKPKRKADKPKVCGKVAKFQYIDTDKDKTYAYCATHKKQHQPYEQEWFDNYVLPDKTENKCAYVLPKKQEQCGKKTKFSCTDGKFYCTTHSKKVLVDKLKGYELKKVKKEKCAKASTFDLAKAICEKLDKCKDKLTKVDEVVIENQPSLINPMMKTVAAFVYNYFVMRGVVDSKDSNIKNVRFMSPSNKLRVNEDKTLEVLTKAKNKENKYKLTKELGIKYTKILLKDEKKWLDHLATYKKQDDLCDALLQGYYFLSKVHEPSKPIKEPEKKAVVNGSKDQPLVL